MGLSKRNVLCTTAVQLYSLPVARGQLDRYVGLLALDQVLEPLPRQTALTQPNETRFYSQFD